MNDEEETFLVGIATAATATATYLAAQPIPEYIKIPVCTILGAIGVGLYAFWSKTVKAQPKEASA